MKKLNENRYSMMVSDVYITCNKGSGMTKQDVRNKCSEYNVDSFYVPLAMIELGVLQSESSSLRGAVYRWGIGLPDHDVIEGIMTLSRKIRRNRYENRKSALSFVEDVTTDECEADATDTNINQDHESFVQNMNDNQLSKMIELDSSDLLSVKFLDEKHYYSKFSYEVVMKLGRIIAQEIIKTNK